MGALGLSDLFPAVDSVEGLSVMDCVSSLDVECVSVSSYGSELVDFCEWLVDSLIHWTHLALLLVCLFLWLLSSH